MQYSVILVTHKTHDLILYVQFVLLLNYIYIYIIIYKN